MIFEDNRKRKRRLSSNDGKRNKSKQHPYGCICGCYDNTPKSQIIVGYPPQQEVPKHIKQPIQRIKEKAKGIITYLKTRLQTTRCAFSIYDHASGKRKKYYMIATIPMWSMKEEKTYIVYSDGRRDTTGILNLSVAIFNSNAPKDRQIIPITDPVEKEKLDWIVGELKDGNKEWINRLRIP